MNMRILSRTAPILIGFVLGILAAVFLPGAARPYLPEWITGKTNIVKGTVTAKEKKDKVLLLTVNTPEGVLLATFRKKVDEINLLINEKDVIELTVPKYKPFIEDPGIIRVVKEQQATPGPAPPAAKPGVQSTREAKPGRQEKQPAATPAPGAAENTQPNGK